MDLSELGRALDAIGVPRQVLALGLRADNSFCVERADDGHWEVFWYERGNKNTLTRLKTESEACLQLLGRLTYSQLLAGAIVKA